MAKPALPNPVPWKESGRPLCSSRSKVGSQYQFPRVPPPTIAESKKQLPLNPNRSSRLSLAAYWRGTREGTPWAVARAWKTALSPKFAAGSAPTYATRRDDDARSVALARNSCAFSTKPCVLPVTSCRTPCRCSPRSGLLTAGVTFTGFAL